MDLRKELIDSLPRTQASTIQRLNALGIHTMYDLLYHAPFRYEDFSTIIPIANVPIDEVTTIRGKIEKVNVVRPRPNLMMIKTQIADQTGVIEATWFNQNYLLQKLRVGTWVVVSGKTKKFGNRMQIAPKEFNVIGSVDIKETEQSHDSASIVPVYHSKFGLSNKTIREKIKIVLNKYLDATPVDEIDFTTTSLRHSFNVIDTKQALFHIHFPETVEDKDKAVQRLAFDELLILQLKSQIVRQQWESNHQGYPFDTSSKKIRKEIDSFIAQFPFELTDDQNKAISDILNDSAKDTPMNRFLQGDVGSGKTAVATVAAYCAYLNGYQTLVMAPTEVLALQHFKTMQSLIKTGLINIALQTGSKKTFTTTEEGNKYDVIVGTHTLLNKNITFTNVGLIIIDEQHRFGVAQRAELKKKGIHPHLLSMTATPIPRTVALTMYGELDMSTITQMPKGRKPIKTAIIPEAKRTKAYEWISKQIKETGTQVYVIYPLIEESETDMLSQVKAATKEYDHLTAIFPNIRIGLLHGRMKPKEKETVMTNFKEKNYDMLVSTSVIEVGIDVPNATIMIIEGAERFGLAQLHQLRGRVGRGEAQSYCFLFPSTKTATYSQRLKIFANTTSGIELAEYDLKLRGAGDIHGTEQSGDGTFRFASFTDMPLIEKAQKAAEQIIKDKKILSHPEIQYRLQKYHVFDIAKD